MTLHRLTRFAAGALATAGAVVAFTAPAAQADISNTLDLGAVLLDQPANQPWAVNLNLGATVVDSTGAENLPISKRFFFEFPKAQVNSNAFAVCKVSDAELIKRGPSACPAASQVGGGTASARALALTFGAKVSLFNGKGNEKTRELVLYATADTVDLTLVLRGTLRKISRGNFGYEFSLPIPDIEVLTGQFASIEGFKVTVGKRITKHGKKISFIDAPTRCTGVGWPFTFRDEFKDAPAVTAHALIPCELKAQVTG